MAQVKGECTFANCPLQPAQPVQPLPPQTRLLLAEAYARQSQSDFKIYQEVLQDVEECHRLHFLQMACEKIAKAYRLRDTPNFPEENLYSHVFFSRFILSLLTSPQIKDRYRSRDAKLKQMVRDGQRLARQIEKLAPAVDREQTPANVEYPWVEGNSVFTPCSYKYGNLSLLTQQNAHEFLRLVTTAIEDFSSIHISG